MSLNKSCCPCKCVIGIELALSGILEQEGTRRISQPSQPLKDIEKEYNNPHKTVRDLANSLILVPFGFYVVMISAIILAAGESKRMGKQNKLLLPFRGQTLIERIVDTVLSSDVGEVIVVLGHQAVRVREVLQARPVKFVQNDNYQEGMTTSIHCGVGAADADADGFMICLSDLPLIEPDELNRLLHAFEEAVRAKNKYIAIPVFERQRGNPVIFSVVYRNDILAHKGLMGCKGIIKQNPAQVLEVEMPTEHVLRDIDTPKDYENLFNN